MQNDLFSYPFLPILLLLAIIFLFVLRFISSPSSKKQQLPPGPKPWPIVGNLLHIGAKAHISITHFAQAYGHLISLRLGTQLLVVASSPAAAIAVLKTHDRLLSGRYMFKVIVDKDKHSQLSLVTSPKCNEHWKSLRSICKANLFTAKAIESQADLRRRKMNDMVEFLHSKQGFVVEIRDFVFTTVFNTLSNLFFSRDLLDFDGKGLNGIKGSLQKMMNLGLTPNLADFYPILEGLDLQSLKKKASLSQKEVDSTWEMLVRERRTLFNKDASITNDFLDVLIQNDFSNDQIFYLITEIITAGIDTTTSTVEWAMTEILKNKDTIKKVKREIQQEIKGNIIDESKISQLQFLQQCVKETLRLYPPAPFLLPRLAPEACEVMGYSIPKNTRIFVNVWGIGRDPLIWEDPLSFKPERFKASDHDFKGYDYRFLPFGGGRRICPGLPMATVQVPLILATLIHNFDWSLPDGEDFSELDLSGKLGITLHKEKPLLLIPRNRI